MKDAMVTDGPRRGIAAVYGGDGDGVRDSPPTATLYLRRRNHAVDTTTAAPRVT